VTALAAQFGLFALVGLVGTAAHYAVLYSLVEFHGMGAVAASGWGALTGLVINYALNYTLTFRSDHAHWRTFPKFALIAGVGLGLNQALMALLVGWGLYYLWAQVLVTGLVLVWNFIGNRWWTFNMNIAPGSQPDRRVRCADRSSLAEGMIKAVKGVTDPWLGVLFGLGPALLGLILAVRLVTMDAYPLVDPSESRYAEMARKMVETGNWVTPQIDYGVPFWGKPPLAVWLNALSFESLGVGTFTARLSAFLLSLGVLWIIYRLAATRLDGARPWVAPTMLAGMALFFVMSGSIAMDQCLLFGTTLALASFWLALRTPGPIHGYLFFIGLAIGLLSKGPIALVLAGLPIGLWVLIRNEWVATWRRIPWIKGTLLMLTLSLPWYLIAEHRTPGFLEYFFVGEHWKRFTEKGWQGDLYGSGRTYPHGSIWLFWLAGALPWSLLFLAVLGQAVRRLEVRRLLASTDGWRLYCLLWMLSPLLFFTLSANLIWTYALPGLPGCALLLAEWRRDGWIGLLSRDSRILAGIGMIVPSALLLMAITLPQPPLPLLGTEKYLVDRYEQERGSPVEGLYYLGEPPYSAQFYLGGKARSIPLPDQLQTFVDTPGRRFFSCTQRNWANLPEPIKTRLEPIGDYGRQRLFRTLEPQGPGE
jgi:4-amino-4-deoxy-L-arabinose transferase-like glycosyltransferase/putative flippase GtrA